MGHNPTPNGRDALAALCRRHGVGILYAFGSRGGDARRFLEDATMGLPAGPSDLDIGVKTDRGILDSAAAKIALATALEDFFGVARVDLVSLDASDPFLADEIIQGERLYARVEEDADEYDLFVLRRAGDLIPLERERADLLLRRSS